MPPTEPTTPDDAAPLATTSGRVIPSSKRGMRTRNALIAAAREVFERDGYLDARISDICGTAEVATGSFYTYFDSKDEVFGAVVDEVQEAMLHPHLGDLEQHGDVLTLIEANNRAYLLAYRDNARLMSLFEQVAQIDPAFRELRRRRGQAFARRNARTIERLQKAGAADPTLEPYYAALAISGMVGRMAYTVFVLGETIPFEDLVSTLTRLWFNALAIDLEAARTA